jgi:hypothetical protein
MAVDLGSLSHGERDRVRGRQRVQTGYMGYRSDRVHG